MAAIEGILFDAYGTLFDVRSLAEACRAAAPDQPALVDLWRAKQLEYSWQRSLMDRYADFWQVTQEALDHTLSRLGLALDSVQRQHLLDAWLTLAPFPEVHDALARLTDYRLAILSNGAPAMLRAVCTHAGLDRYLEAIISADEAGSFKPAAAVYGLGAWRLNAPASQVLFVSANAWDAIGAKAFGYQVAWLNRDQAPFDPLGYPPDLIVSSLDELVGHLHAA